MLIKKLLSLTALTALTALTVLATSPPLISAALAATWEPTPGHKQIPIWPGAAPNALPSKGPEYFTPNDGVNNVTRPTMTVYSPSIKNTGAAVIVCPGGGYKDLAMDLEGTEICDWLVSRGLTAILLKYRVPSEKLFPPRGSLQALQDAQRTLGLVRQRAAQWHIDPHKIGVIGFSAGGHLVAAISTRYAHRLYPFVDAADKVSCRPDFAIPVYPGHLWIDKNKFELNSDIRPTKDTPPTFLLQNEDDPVDPVEHSLVYYRALKKAGVPVEMHLYAQGGHAFGLRPSKLPVSKWPRLAETWLATIGMIPAQE
ncbi:MAG: alpha/beta hydrolase [Cyanobacteria bacterium REEB67]|nr:alpha/beta hydrolase [Cyanobacteria bacterium REEB67]